jgi:hypothetical protein
VHHHHSPWCTSSSLRFYFLLSPVMLPPRSVPINSLSVSWHYCNSLLKTKILHSMWRIIFNGGWC